MPVLVRTHTLVSLTHLPSRNMLRKESESRWDIVQKSYLSVWRSCDEECQRYFFYAHEKGHFVTFSLRWSVSNMIMMKAFQDILIDSKMT